MYYNAKITHMFGVAEKFSLKKKLISNSLYSFMNMDSFSGVKCKFSSLKMLACCRLLQILLISIFAGDKITLLQTIYSLYSTPRQTYGPLFCIMAQFNLFV